MAALKQVTAEAAMGAVMSDQRGTSSKARSMDLVFRISQPSSLSTICWRALL